jgi:hypothetical protein
VRTRLLIVPLLAALAVGCSDSDDPESNDTSTPTGEAAEEATGDEEIVAGLIAAHFVASGADPNALQFGDEGAQCAAEGTVEELGVARLEELGVDPAGDEITGNPLGGLTDDESVAVFDVIDGCIDLESQVVRLFTAEGLTDEQATCIAERYLDTDLLRRSVLSDPDPELNAEIDETLTTAAASCVN